VSHATLKLEHFRQELIVSILDNIWMLVAIHIHTLSKLDMAISKLVEPSACHALPQQLLQVHVETQENCFIYTGSKFLRGNSICHLLCKPAVAGSFYVGIAQEGTGCSKTTTALMQAHTSGMQTKFQHVHGKHQQAEH
jgi:hypothetical protein